jgi:tetratricopeptide (TPR) repeat protein
VLILLAITQVNKSPLLSFAILYYFLNHLVESTIIPLELIFEHRNLLPSLFLFLPLAAFAVDIIKSKKWAAIITTLTCTFFLVQSGHATIERNRAWKNAGTLNEDALIKAPGSARVKLNLAGWYAGQKRLQEAFNLCEEAEQLAASGASRNTIIPIARMQKGSIAYDLGQPERALKYFQQAYSLRKDYTAAAEKLIAVLIELKHYDEALRIITERYILKEDSNLLLLRASVFLRQEKPSKALATYQQAEPFYPNTSLVLVGKAKALSLQGDYDRSTILLGKAVQQNNLVAMLLQIENTLLAGNKQEASRQLTKLIRTVPLTHLLNNLHAAEKDPFQIPLNEALLRQALLKTASRMLSKPSDKK